MGAFRRLPAHGSDEAGEIGQATLKQPFTEFNVGQQMFEQISQ
jgi:hypothetical protein